MNHKKSWLLLVCIVLCWLPASAQETRPGKRMRLYLEVYAGMLPDPALAKAIDEYGVHGLDIHRVGLSGLFPLPAFPRLPSKTDPEALARLRRQLEPYKRKGVEIMLSGPEPLVPPEFFEAYPEARNVSNGMLWKYLEQRTTEFFRQIPELDGFRCHFWEAPLLNDSNYFSELFWAKPAEIYRTASPYYAPADYLKAVIAALSRGAQAAHKRYAITSFSHHPWQERLVIEALRSVDPETPFDVWHLPLSGDFDPYRPPNPAIASVTGRQSTLLFDGYGEYLGWALMPYACPGQIQRQIQHALARNPDIRGLATRTSFSASGVPIFGTVNEVNLYALAQFARNPDAPVEKVWSDWAERRFGKAAAPKVISALARTYEIGNLSFYFRGVWMHNHSFLSTDLPYMEAKILHTGRSMIEWRPDDIENNALIRELMEQPGERTIRVAVADRLEAMRLNRLSLDDVEAAKPALSPAEYENLQAAFTLQRHFIETSIPHIEAFLRYWIAKKTANPPAENRARLEEALASLDAKAAQVDRLYGERVPFLTGKLIRKYTAALRKSAPFLNAPAPAR